MNQEAAITCMFVDIGGVLLSNGWDRHARKQAAARFALDLSELEERHHLVFETYETGKLTLDEYLDLVVFYQKRPLTREQFRECVFAQTQPYPEMIALLLRVKELYRLKILAVNNEARELNAHRIRTFKLDAFIDGFVSSGFVHLRKPDADIFRLALDIAQVPARQIVCIDDQPLFVEVAKGLGMRGIVHTDYKSTVAGLAALGLTADQDGVQAG
ncbi:HAD family phosphatase [uncultured Desulfobulbus sp.]|uniref:HAD family hydrolase n=1 Tax=uncultured Desulfobulbus sp. TaxID=239745 RepID=UPI0029C90CA4|nr:HAD family phosphatase [uncultured Desulfobulbus sp.]